MNVQGSGTRAQPFWFNVKLLEWVIFALELLTGLVDCVRLCRDLRAPSARTHSLPFPFTGVIYFTPNSLSASSSQMLA